MDGELLGTIAELWRFPVKSMLGESLGRVDVGPMGIQGDRAFALRDARDGRIVSAKRTPAMLAFRAAYPAGTAGPPDVTLADGRRLRLDAPDATTQLSAALGRAIAISGPEDQSDDRRTEWDDENSFDAPPFAFVDLAPIHILTSASLRALAAIYPAGRVDVRRFRPNVLIDCGARDDFADDTLTGRLLAFGNEVRLRVFMPTIRCVMTTVAQADLPKDPAILRTVVERHEGNLGAYATVEVLGSVSVGDSVRLLPE